MSYSTRTTRKHVIRDRNDLLYISSFGLLILGLTFSAVPIYKMFCSKTGFGGTPKIVETQLNKDKIKPLTEYRKLRINFISSTNKLLNWSFEPEQDYIEVVPGETALAFFKAKNLSKLERLTGISSYNIIPDQAAPYFNKIQCFCFEEQTLEPQEEVDMPVFFFVDDDILNDPNTAKMEGIVLSYTFFKAK